MGRDFLRGTSARFACWLAFLLLGFSFSASAGPIVYRVIYEDDPILKQDRALIEKAYGAKLYIIPPSGQPPKSPVVLEGVVLPVDPVEDVKWVVGTQNPNLRFEKIQNRIQGELLFAIPDMKDIQEKWDEYRFLEKVAREVMPPEMHLGSEFDPASLPAEIRTQVETRVKQLMVSFGLKDVALESDLVRLESIRHLVNERMGKSIFKVRDFSHSEGKLPKSHKDWAQIFLDYHLTSRDQVKQLEKEVRGTSRSLDHEVVDLPNIEGRALEVLLREPSRTIVQKMISIQTEVRLHIVEGEILEGATFLRYYVFGKYLSREEMEKIHGVIRSELLPQLTRRFGKFSCTPDVVIESGTGRVRILDLNSDLQSGYFYPEEDLFTTNLLAARYSGEKTELLRDWDHVLEGRMAGDLAERARAFLQKYRPFVNEYNEGAFWDRVLLIYMDELRTEPTSERFAKALFQLARIGLRNSEIFYQFIREAQDRWPELRFREHLGKAWMDYLNRKGTSEYFYEINRAGQIEGKVQEEVPLPSVPICSSVLKAAGE